MDGGVRSGAEDGGTEATVWECTGQNAHYSAFGGTSVLSVFDHSSTRGWHMTLRASKPTTQMPSREVAREMAT